jgi:hypothetical protein
VFAGSTRPPVVAGRKLAAYTNELATGSTIVKKMSGGFEAACGKNVLNAIGSD